MADRFQVSQSGHAVNILPPVNVTGGAISQAVSLALAGHLSILLQIGVAAAATGLITLQAGSATAAVGTNMAGAVAIPFNIAKQETAGAANDVPAALVAVPATGFTPANESAIFYVLEVEASQLPAGSNYVQLVIANGTNSVIASAVAVLSGLRFAGDSNPTATL